MKTRDPHNDVSTDSLRANYFLEIDIQIVFGK